MPGTQSGRPTTSRHPVVDELDPGRSGDEQRGDTRRVEIDTADRARHRIGGRTSERGESTGDRRYRQPDVGTEKRATGLGGAVILPSTPTPMGPFAVVADPMGAAFQVMQIQEMATTESD